MEIYTLTLSALKIFLRLKDYLAPMIHHNLRFTKIILFASRVEIWSCKKSYLVGCFGVADSSVWTRWRELREKVGNAFNNISTLLGAGGPRGPDTAPRAKTVEAILGFAEASERFRSRAPRGQQSKIAATRPRQAPSRLQVRLRSDTRHMYVHWYSCCKLYIA